jgi:hypothetical protein
MKVRNKRGHNGLDCIGGTTSHGITVHCSGPGMALPEKTAVAHTMMLVLQPCTICALAVALVTGMEIHP